MRRAVHLSRVLAFACSSLCCLCALGSLHAADRGLAAVKQTGEWHRMATLWHVMLDHTSNLISSVGRFQALAQDMDRMDADVGELAKRGLLPESTGTKLRALFHRRYRYIEEKHYTTESRITLSSLEAAAVTAQWIVELELSVMRRAAAGSPELARRDVPAAEKVIAYELTFLEAHETFEAEAERRRLLLAEEGASGKQPDWHAFENDCERRRNLLLEAYRDRRIRLSRSVRGLMPCLVALTTARPPSPLATSESAGPGA